MISMSKSVRREKNIERIAEIKASLSAAVEIEEEESSQNLQNNEESEDDSIMEIERVQALGISVSEINKLKAAGIHTVAGLLMQSKKASMKIRGISEAKMDRIFAACAQLSNTNFMTAVDYMAKRKSVVKVTTGSEALDSILGGGIESASITELFGEFRTGKTQLSHTLCVTAQLPKENRGGNGKVAYIDTDGSFRPERIIPIAERFGIDPMMTLENILYARAYNHDQQDALINSIASKMVDDQFSLLIIDSFTSLFRVEFTGREELAARQQAIGLMMNKLSKMANEFNISVVITNQVMADPSNSASTNSAFSTDPKKPIGGHVLAHASTTRLYLRKGRGDQRICRVYDSPCLAEVEAAFCISNEGIIDAYESPQN